MSTTRRIKEGFANRIGFGLRAGRLAFVLTCLMAVLGGQAEAKKDKNEDGVPIKVVVKDELKQAIPTAVIRHPDEQDRHRVNALTGAWEESKLYLPDGRELIFVPGMTLKLEVSAPGYMTKVIQYDVRKRKNVIEVELSQLVFDEQDVEEPTIRFGRDKPRDVGGVGPAN